MTLTTVKWTVDDYHRMLDAGILVDKTVELLDGEIVEMSPEGILHADLSDEAAGYLRGLLEKVIVFRDPADGEYQQKQPLSQGSIAPLAFPDLSVPIHRLVE
jgi:Uma2 family endonuclease